jgi:hypothetical protein
LKSIVLIVFLAFYSFADAQVKYGIVDSITQSNFNHLCTNEQAIFKKILSKRKHSHLQIRTDTTNTDYSFIYESYNINTKENTLSEYYFNQNDSLPKAVLHNKISMNLETYFYDDYEDYFSMTRYYETFKPMYYNYNKLLPYQTLSYDSLIIISAGCVVWEEYEKERADRLVKEREDKLNGTYQILTMIDHRNKKVIVSFQIPTKNYHFKVRRYNPVWDF